MGEGPPVMPMHGQPTKQGDEATDGGKSDPGDGDPLTSGLRVSSKRETETMRERLDHLEAEVIHLKDEACTTQRAMSFIELRLEAL